MTIITTQKNKCQKILPKKGVLKKCKLERKNGVGCFTMQLMLFYHAKQAPLQCNSGSVTT